MFSLCMSFAGLFFAFFKGWWFSLLLLFAFPVLFIMTTLVTIVMQSGFSENMKSYAQSAGYAEQALNAIRVVVAFGMEETEMRNYGKHLDRARTIAIKSLKKSGLTVGGFFFGMFAYYAYAFFIGTILITSDVINTNTGDDYTSGDILACFFGVVFGVFALGMATPNIKAVSEGRVAGKMAFDIIERKPKIPLDEANSKKLNDI